MKRLMQSGLGVGLLVLLVVLAVVNTAQLNNLEARMAAIEKGGVRTTAGSATTSASPVSVASSTGVCYASPDDQAALADPANLLAPFEYPPDWPAHITRGGTLKRQTGQDPPGLNVYASNNAAELSEVYRYVTGHLAFQSTHDPDNWYPDLATKITRTDDGMVYDVYLRKGVLWHPAAVDLTDPRHAWLQGKHELTAEDFAFSLAYIKNPQVLGRAASLRTYFESVDHVEVVDPYHFRVHYNENSYMNRPVLLDLEPMPRWLYLYDEDGNKFEDATWGEKQNSHWYNQKAIGVGMYRFVRWLPGELVEFEKNPDYYLSNCFPATFDRIEIKILKDQQSWLRRLKTGEIDYTQIQPQQYMSEIKGKEPYLGEEHIKYTTNKEASFFYIGWNSDRPMFADKRVRTAMTYAFDRQGLVESVFGGLGAVTSGPFDQENPCYDQTILPLPYDLERAAALLDEAGWKDTDGDGLRDKVVDGVKVPFEFSLVIYGNSSEYETLARVYREALQRIGIRMNAQPLEWAAQLKKVSERDFDAFTGAWVPGWEVDLYQIWHSKEADRTQSSNYVSFRNADADRIIEALRLEFDEPKREELCHAFHALINEEQPYTFFYQRQRPVLYWDHLNTPVFSKVNPYRDARLFSFASIPASE